MAATGIHMTQVLLNGLLLKVLAACLGYAVWMMPMIITTPGVFELCAEYDIQAPTPASEEEEELKHSKLVPTAAGIAGHMDLDDPDTAVLAAMHVPPASLLEVPYPPPRPRRC